MDAVRFHISCEIKPRNNTTYASQTFVHQNCRQNFVFFFSVTDICTWIPVFRIHANTACRRRCSISGAHKHKLPVTVRISFKLHWMRGNACSHFWWNTITGWKKTWIGLKILNKGHLWDHDNVSKLTPPLSSIQEKIVLVLFGRIVSS